MRIPDCGPFGETLLEAKTLAIVAAFFLNRPSGGCVESVVTDRTHLFLLRSATCCPPGMLSTTADGTPPSAKVGILWPKDYGSTYLSISSGRLYRFFLRCPWGCSQTKKLRRALRRRPVCRPGYSGADDNLRRKDVCRDRSALNGGGC